MSDTCSDSSGNGIRYLSSIISPLSDEVSAVCFCLAVCSAVRDPEEAWQRHVGDSLALLPIIDRHLSSSTSYTPATSPPLKSRVGGSTPRRIPLGEGSQGTNSAVSTSGADEGLLLSNSPLRIIDVGTGAGLPGMVIAAARPHWKVIQMEEWLQVTSLLISTSYQTWVLL